MNHWMLLIRTSSVYTLHKEPGDFHQKSPGTARERRLWFLLGCLEFLPTGTGLVLNEYLQPLFFSYDYLIFGILLSIVMIVILYKKSPPPPITLQHNVP